jgi:hypothetical protein
MRLISGPPGKAMSRCPMFFYLCPVQYVLHICAREAGKQFLDGHVATPNVTESTQTCS